VLAHSSQKPAIGTSIVKAASHRIPGDREIRGAAGLTVQIHTFSIRDEQGNEIASNVPAIALWVPSEMAADWVVQDNP
jgi:hypothetical protein